MNGDLAEILYMSIFKVKVIVKREAEGVDGSGVWGWVCSSSADLRAWGSVMSSSAGCGQSPGRKRCLARFKHHITLLVEGKSNVVMKNMAILLYLAHLSTFSGL